MPTPSTLIDLVALHLLFNWTSTMMSCCKFMINIYQQFFLQLLHGYQPLSAVVKFSERMHNYFVSELLRCQDKEIQVEVLHHLIKVGLKCLMK